MNDAQHAAMKLAVVGSLAADSNRENHNNVYRLRPKVTCGVCGGGHLTRECDHRAA